MTTFHENLDSAQQLGIERLLIARLEFTTGPIPPSPKENDVYALLGVSSQKYLPVLSVTSPRELGSAVAKLDSNSPLGRLMLEGKWAYVKENIADDEKGVVYVRPSIEERAQMMVGHDLASKV